MGDKHDHNQEEKKNDHKKGKKDDHKTDTKDDHQDDIKDGQEHNIIVFDTLMQTKRPDNINTNSHDNNTTLNSPNKDSDEQGKSSTIDTEGDLIMESLKALIEEHTMAEIFTQPDSVNTDTVSTLEGSHEDINYISLLSLKNSTRKKLDTLSITARHQLIKKIDTLTQSDTVAGQRLHAFRKQNHHLSSRGRIIRPTVKGIEALNHSTVSLGQSGTTTTTNSQ
ncbi:hypothetical protein INT45_007024 [Circinella minor]|uniref:Uncharacterized protein n=1 Tax=Circinella minor TaxID=1195481 RepID=A0A8H7VNT6_9FUNG|nr:hypothetical protein INT45_007024 [Circinella minor]